MEVLKSDCHVTIKVAVLDFFISSYFFIDKFKIFPIITEIVFNLNTEFYLKINSTINAAALLQSLNSQNRNLFASGFNGS